MEQKIEEHRKSQRFLLEGFGVISFDTHPDTYECYIYNISVGGMMIYTKYNFKIEEQFKISITVKEKTFERNVIVKSVREFTKKRKYILQIGKSLDVTLFANVQFTEVLSMSELEYIKINN